MSAEAAVAALLRADTELMAILSGGIYEQGEMTPEGITRETCPDAFDDVSGFLLPIALVKQRGLIPDGNVADFEAGAHSVAQTVEIWLYQAIDFEQLDLAVPVVLSALQGVQLEDSFELQLVNMLDRQRDTGALMDASLIRMDFYVASVLQPL